MKAPVLVALALLAGTVAPARAEVEFSGYLQFGPELKFVLSDPAADKKSGWLARGGTFDGYTVVDFDQEKELLSVEKGGKTTQLPLRTAAVRVAPSTSTAGPAPTSDNSSPGQRTPMRPVAAGNKPELTKQLEEARAQWTAQSARYQEAHPAMITLRARITEIEKHLTLLSP